MSTQSRKKRQDSKKAGQLDLLSGFNETAPGELTDKLSVIKPIKLPKQDDNFQLWIESCVYPVLVFTCQALSHCDAPTQARLGTELFRIMSNYQPPNNKLELHNHTHINNPQNQSAQLAGFLFDVDVDVNPVKEE